MLKGNWNLPGFESERARKTEGGEGERRRMTGGAAAAATEGQLTRKCLLLDFHFRAVEGLEHFLLHRKLALQLLYGNPRTGETGGVRVAGGKYNYSTISDRV